MQLDTEEHLACQAHMLLTPQRCSYKAWLSSPFISEIEA